MIQIKTKNGNILINDAEVIKVQHDHDTHTVLLMGKGLRETIYDVESVIYANEATPTEWKDEGSEVKRLVERVAYLDSYIGWMAKIEDNLCQKLRYLGQRCVDIANYKDEVPKTIRDEFRQAGEDAKSFVNDREYAPLRLRPTQDLDNADEVQRLNCIIDNLVRERDAANELAKKRGSVIEALANENKDLKQANDNLTKLVTLLQNRSLLDRIFNKKTYL